MSVCLCVYSPRILNSMDFWSDDDKYNDYHDNNLKFVTHNKDNPNNGLFQAFSEVKWSPICGMI